MGHIEGKNSNRYVRAALYARVSSEQQAQTQTIASQIEALKDRIAKDGLELDQELSFIDDGYSGASLVRPALERLRDMAALGAIDKLYVLCPDRFARNYAFQVLVIDELQCCGVELVFLVREAVAGDDDVGHDHEGRGVRRQRRGPPEQLVGVQVDGRQIRVLPP